MASLHVAFCSHGLVAIEGESVVSEVVTTSASNAQSSASTAGKPFVRIATDSTAHYVAFGSNPNAQTGTTARYYMPANSVAIFQINVGNKVAAITA
jgi:hypothetical protein